ncbi:universal stress protein [Jiella sp. M17.18]|uniref:universal stress protein n=1 Tax=Jiella sp. M17.18 TaxID=3234247 RepID=UPI0034DE0C7B
MVQDTLQTVAAPRGATADLRDTSSEPGRAAPSYRTLLVVADAADDASGRLRLAVSLADRFRAELIGVAASQVEWPVFVSEYPQAVDQILRQEEERAAEDLSSARTLFEREAGERKGAAWFQAVAAPLSFVHKHGCEADLLVCGRRGPTDPNPGAMGVGPGDLVMAVGRPVLVVSPGIDQLGGKRIVIGWKDTREARRALADALPFLARAEEVTIALVGRDASRHDGELPQAFLRRHDISADIVVDNRVEDFIAARLVEIAVEGAADLLIVGAYGHSRAREWAFGGVTRDLLDGSQICTLLSR